MTRFDSFKNSGIKSLSQWVSDFVPYEGSPWEQWFDTNYCKKCCPITKGDNEFAYCEVNHKCFYFPQLEHNITNQEIIQKWLELDIDKQSNDKTENDIYFFNS